MARLPFLAVIAFSFSAALAHADAIDGNWCAGDGRSLTIDGSSIHTPTGAELTGEYTRHAFRYIGEIGSAEEAHDVRMQLWADDELRIDRIVDGAPQPQETWRRCKPIV